MLKKNLDIMPYADVETSIVPQGESCAILDVLSPDVHSDLLRSFNFAINNFSYLLSEFDKYTDVIHFDNINDKVLCFLDEEYKNLSSIDLSKKKRNTLVKKNAMITDRSGLENIVVDSANILKKLDNDFMGKVMYLLYINLVEEELKIRLAKIKVSDENKVFQDVFKDGKSDDLAEFLVNKEGLGDDYLFLFPILKNVGDNKLVDMIIENFEGTRQKELISIFKKEIKGKDYIRKEAGLDLFGTQSFYSDRQEISNSFEKLLHKSFLKDSTMIEKITNVGAIEFNATQSRVSQVSDMQLVLKIFGNINDVVNFFKGKLKNIEQQTEDTLTTFDIFLYYNIKKIVDFLASSGGMTDDVVVESLKILGKNINFVGSGWGDEILEIYSKHNSATNEKMDPFINVTLKIGDNYLEKQGRIGFSSSISSILGKYKNVLSVKRISERSKMHEYSNIIKKKRLKLKNEQKSFEKEIKVKIERIKAFMGNDDGNDGTVFRFKLQLINKIKNYIVNKIVLDNIKDVSSFIVNDDGFEYLDKKTQGAISGILTKEDRALLYKFLNSELLFDKIKKEQLNYNAKKFLSIHIADNNEDDLFYDIINTCAELNHPVYKWKTEFEAGIKFYVNAHAKIMPERMSQYVQKATFEKLINITDDLYEKFIFADYDKSQFATRFDMDERVLFFDLDENAMKKIIMKKVIEEFLRENTFLKEIMKKTKSERTILDGYVIDIVNYLKFLLTK